MEITRVESRNKSSVPPRYFLHNQGSNVDRSGLHLTANRIKEDRTQQAVSSAQPPGKPLLQQMMPVLQVLRLLGGLPLHFSSSGTTTQFHLISWAMLYSLCFYLLLLVAMRFSFASWMDGGNKGGADFSKTIFGVLGIIIASEIVVIPATHWYEARNMAKLLSDWSKFQELYTRGTGKSLQFNLPRRRLIMLLLTATVILIVQQIVYELLFYDCNLQSWNYRDITVYILVFELRNFTAILWVLLCRSTKTAGRSMLHHFRQDLETSSRPPDTVSNYMGHWLELSRLAAYIGTAFCNVYSHLIVYLVATLTIYLYYLIFMLMDGVSNNFAWLFIEAAFALLLLFQFCDSATGVYQQVGVSFRDYLLSVRLNPKYWSTQNEVDAFLRMLEVEPPIISLNGYVTINRALLSSVGSMLVTYLVVLVQFRLSSSNSWKL